VVPGDNCFLVTTRNQVLVRGSGEALGKAILNGGCHERFSATCGFGAPIFDRVGNVTLLRGGDDRCLAAQAQIETQYKGIEEVLREIEPAFAFDVIFKVVIPNARFPELYGVVRQVHARQSLISSETRQSGTLLHRWAEGAVLVSRVVVVPECHQRMDLQSQVLGYFETVVLPQFIVNNRTVFAVNHKHGLLDLDVAYLIRKNWKRVEAKLFEITESFGVNDARMAVSR